MTNKEFFSKYCFGKDFTEDELRSLYFYNNDIGEYLGTFTQWVGKERVQTRVFRVSKYYTPAKGKRTGYIGIRMRLVDDDDPQELVATTKFDLQPCEFDLRRL